MEKKWRLFFDLVLWLLLCWAMGWGFGWVLNWAVGNVLW